MNTIEMNNNVSPASERREEQGGVQQDQLALASLAVSGHPEQGSLQSGHRLRVTVFEARDIKRTNFFSNSSDTYAEIGMLAREGCVKTSLQRDSLEPSWNEQFDVQLGLVPQSDVLCIILRGRHLLRSDAFIGRVELPIAMLLAAAATRDSRSIESLWLPLLPNRTCFSAPAQTIKGSIRVGLEYFFDPIEEQRQLFEEALMTGRRQSTAAATSSTAAGEQQARPEQFERCDFCDEPLPRHLLPRHVEVHMLDQKQQKSEQQQKVAAAAPSRPLNRVAATATQAQEQRDLSMAVAASLAQHQPQQELPLAPTIVADDYHSPFYAQQQQQRHALYPPQIY